MMQPGLSVQQAMLTTLRARTTLTNLLGGAHIYELFLTLEITTNMRFRAQAQAITQEIETALDGAALVLTDHKLVNLRCVFNNVSRNKATDAFVAVMRFRAATEPI
jgi:hypothetical protein